MVSNNQNIFQLFGNSMIGAGTFITPFAAIPSPASPVLMILGPSMAGLGAATVGMVKLCRICRNWFQGASNQFHQMFCRDDMCTRCSGQWY